VIHKQAHLSAFVGLLYFIKPVLENNVTLLRYWSNLCQSFNLCETK